MQARSPTPAVLVVAGLDPSGGAGLAADLDALAAMDCHGLVVATAWTAQDGQRVHHVETLSQRTVALQIDTAVAASRPAAVKAGMLGGRGPATALADWLENRETAARPPFVLDPVLAASDGTPLLDEEGEAVVRSRLLGLATLITPNAQEAARWTGRPIPSNVDEAAELARALVDMGPAAAVVTGGHLAGPPTNILFDGVELHRFVSGERLADAHGTGCRFASACAGGLATGMTLVEAVSGAGKRVAAALAGPRLKGGRILAPRPA